MKLKRFLALIALLGSMVACVDRQNLSALDKKTQELEAQVQALQASLKRIENQRSWDELIRDTMAIAYLTPGANGYSTVHTDLGTLTVSLENIQPYANGSRITLRLGNLTGATILGTKATLDWGSVDEKGIASNESAKSREISFSESLERGTWTIVNVVLEGVPPAQLGFVRVKDIKHSGIRLAVGR